MKVPYEEDGAGQGGYAKEMSDEYKKAEQAMLTDEVAKADVVITTALIPGRKAPVLIPEAMVAGMKRGSVIVDMASVNGGNVIGTIDGEKVTTANGVSILGYSDLPSRLPTAASQLCRPVNHMTFANSASKRRASDDEKTSNSPL